MATSGRSKPRDGVPSSAPQKGSSSTRSERSLVTEHSVYSDNGRSRQHEDAVDSSLASSTEDGDFFSSHNIEKSWVEIMEEEAMALKSNHAADKFVQSASCTSRLQVKGDTDFSGMMGKTESIVHQTNGSVSSSLDRRGSTKKRNLSDLLDQDNWTKVRSVVLLNQEDTCDIGNVPEEDSLSNECQYDSESTLQEMKSSSPFSGSQGMQADCPPTAKKVRHEGPTLLPSYMPPRTGWEWDECVIERRNRDLFKGYNSDVYKRYIAKYPKREREQRIHPVTPNKYIKMSRRSWDMQVRIWRRSLYSFMGEAIESDSSILSSSTSDVSSSTSYDSDAASVSSVSLCEASLPGSRASPCRSEDDTLTGL
uniref:SLBP_RNA_bind domain-containing protein n=1 Tax=Trichuris muris TaxID=70415 RepID=A0A5S6QNG1_TRIMR